MPALMTMLAAAKTAMKPHVTLFASNEMIPTARPERQRCECRRDAAGTQQCRFTESAGPGVSNPGFTDHLITSTRPVDSTDAATKTGTRTAGRAIID
jgi:hypothetical protein